MRASRALMAAAAAVLVATLAGCQTGRDDAGSPGGAGDGTATSSPDDPVSDDDPTTPEPSDEPLEPAAPVAADLTIVVDATGEGATTTYTLTCDPVGGDHPDAEAACAAIAVGGLAAFEPTPMGVACTEQWGGPQTATVDGTVAGETVHAEYNRTNGCEISRWEALAPLFGPDAGLM